MIFNRLKNYFPKNKTPNCDTYNNSTLKRNKNIYLEIKSIKINIYKILINLKHIMPNEDVRPIRLSTA